MEKVQIQCQCDNDDNWYIDEKQCKDMGYDGMLIAWVCSKCGDEWNDVKKG